MSKTDSAAAAAATKREQRRKAKENTRRAERNAYETTHHKWIGEIRPVWQDSTTFRARSDLVNMWSQDYDKNGKSKNGSHSSDSDSDSDSDDNEDDDECLDGASLLEDEECTSACGNVRELAVVNMSCGRAVPRGITDILFVKLLATTATNHA